VGGMCTIDTALLKQCLFLFVKTSWRGMACHVMRHTRYYLSTTRQVVTLGNCYCVYSIWTGQKLTVSMIYSVLCFFFLLRAHSSQYHSPSGTASSFGVRQ